MTTATRFTRHQDVAAVEHDETGKPVEGGIVHHATVTAVDANAALVRYSDESVFGGKTDGFWLSGWRVQDGYDFRWRLVPVCRCGSPVLGEPVTDPDDRTGRVFCSDGCRDAEAEASHGAMAARER